MKTFFIIGNVLPTILIAIVAVAAGVGLGIFLFREHYKKMGKTSSKIIEDAKKLAEENRKKEVLETKQEIHLLKQDADKEIRQLKQDADKEIKEKKKSANDLEQKLLQREERLDNRSSNLDKREETLNQKEQKIDQKKADLEKQYSKVDELIEEQNKKLIEISGLKADDARKIILERIEEEMSVEIAVKIKEAEEKAKLESNRKAQSLLANAIQQYASDTVSEKTVSVVPLPSDEMKGRIIGREGRNIRAIESSTGVDYINDNLISNLLLCQDKLVIYDNKLLLNKDYSYRFFETIKNILDDRKNVFEELNSNQVLYELNECIRKNDIESYCSQNNEIVMVRNNKILTTMVAWGDASSSDALNYYRDNYRIYSNKNYKVRFVVKTTLANGLEDVAFKLVRGKNV